MKVCSPEKRYTKRDKKNFYQSMALGAADEKFAAVLSSTKKDEVTEVVKEDD